MSTPLDASRAVVLRARAAARGPVSGTHRDVRRWALGFRAHRWLLGWLALALLISLVPVALAACCAPAGRTGLGTVWFVNDYAQYEAAMRQGAAGQWLVRDPFTAEPHAPAFMFPLYVAVGKAAAVTGLPAGSLERLLEVVARALFVLSLWRFASGFASGRGAARAAFLLALFGSGIGLFVGAAGTALGAGAPYVGTWSYETTTFGLLFAAPHVPLAMAATLELARWLLPGRRATPVALAGAAALGLGIALLQAFHVPVLLAAMGVTGLVWWRGGRGPHTLLAAVVAAIGALPALAPTVVTFSFDPFWGRTYTLQNLLPSPLPHELVVELGVALALALVGIWRLGWRVAPFGLLVWVLLAISAMYAPVPYQRRLAFGLHPALAVLAGNALAHLGASLTGRPRLALRLGVAAVAASGTLLVVAAVTWSSLANAPLAVYRSTPELDGAASWLDRHARTGEVILADWDVSNYLAPRTEASVLGGHPVATLQPDQKRFLISTYFAHGGSLELAWRLGADWVVYGPHQADLPGPLETPAFQSGGVRVYRVEQASR